MGRHGSGEYSFQAAKIQTVISGTTLAQVVAKSKHIFGRAQLAKNWGLTNASGISVDGITTTLHSRRRDAHEAHEHHD
jgi:hypothetical protein